MPEATTALGRKLESFGAAVREHTMSASIYARATAASEGVSTFTSKAIAAIAVIGIVYGGAILDFDRTAIDRTKATQLEFIPFEQTEPGQPPEQSERITDRSVKQSDSPGIVMPDTTATRQYKKKLDAFIQVQLKSGHRDKPMQQNVVAERIESIKALQSALDYPCKVKPPSKVDTVAFSLSCQGAKDSAPHKGDATIHETFGAIVEVGSHNGATVYVAEKEGFGTASLTLKGGGTAVVIDNSALQQIMIHHQDPNHRDLVIDFLVTQRIERDKVSGPFAEEEADSLTIAYLLNNGVSRHDAKQAAIAAVTALVGHKRTDERLSLEENRKQFLAFCNRLERIELIPLTESKINRLAHN